MFEVIRMLRLFARTNSFVVYLQVRTRAGGNFEFATVGVTVDVRAPTKGIMTGKCTGRVRVISSVGRRGSSVSRFEGPKPKIGTPRPLEPFIGTVHIALGILAPDRTDSWLKGSRHTSVSISQVGLQPILGFNCTYKWLD